MNTDINRDVVERFDRDGRPLNYLGEIIPDGGGKRRLLFSAELLKSIRKAQRLVEIE